MYNDVPTNRKSNPGCNWTCMVPLYRQFSKINSIDVISKRRRKTKMLQLTFIVDGSRIEPKSLKLTVQWRKTKVVDVSVIRNWSTTVIDFLSSCKTSSRWCCSSGTDWDWNPSNDTNKAVAQRHRLQDTFSVGNCARYHQTRDSVTCYRPKAAI